MKPWISYFLIAITLLYSSAALSAQRNLAYDDSFIFYVAGRLAAQTGHALEFEKKSPELRAQYLGDLTLLYHRALVSCDGPLKQLAYKFDYFMELHNGEPDFGAVLIYLGKMEYAYWPLVRAWESSVHEAVIKRFTSREVTAQLPSCQVDGYRPPEP